MILFASNIYGLDGVHFNPRHYTKNYIVQAGLKKIIKTFINYYKAAVTTITALKVEISLAQSKIIIIKRVVILMRSICQLTKFRFQFRPNLVNSGSGSGQISIPVYGIYWYQKILFITIFILTIVSVSQNDLHLHFISYTVGVRAQR